MHESALVDDQVSVELAPPAIVCGLAEIVTVGAGVVTVTVADCDALPPPPVQLSVKVLLLVNAPVDWVPLGALVPVHDAEAGLAEAVQVSALFDDQVSVELAPLAIVCGLAEIVIVGAGGVTVTVADCSRLPPPPVQVSEKVLVAVNAPVDCEPLVALVPVHAPEAAHESALVDDQVSVELAPLAMVCGAALMVTVGAGGVTVTVADCEAVPPAPVQLREKVLVLANAGVDWEPLVALAPVHAPEAVHVSASVDDQVRVDVAPLAMVCGLAVIVTVGGVGGGAAVTVTVADCVALPPAPVQASVNVLVVESAPVDCEPVVGTAPDHAPEAVQLVAFVEDQVSVELAPVAIACGLAEIVTVGGAATVTVADCVALPPVPVQASVNVPVLESEPVDCEPLVALAPVQAPEAVHVSALVDDQVRVELAPLAIVCGLAEIVTVGGGAVTVTVADCAALPPLPVQLSEKVPLLVNAPVDCVPLVALLPDQAPEAVQVVALVEDQVSVELAPLAMVCGLAEIVTVGGGGVTVTVADCRRLPPLPVQVSEKVLVAVNAPVDCVPLVALAPDHAPEAVQPVASVDDQVSVALVPLAMVCGAALMVTVGAGAFTVTVADCELVPPAPVQLREKVPVLVRAPVDCEPLVALAPVHAPEAVQLTALVEDQVSVELAPFAIVCGLALIVTVGGAGGGATTTVADCEVVPPVPEQVSVNVLLLVSAPVDCVPLVVFAPAHAADAGLAEAVQVSALVDVQVRVELAPLEMLRGLAPITTLGAGGPGVGGGGVGGVGAGDCEAICGVLTGSLPQPAMDSTARSANSQVLRMRMDLMRPFFEPTGIEAELV